MDLDTLLGTDIVGPMGERVDIEVGAKLPVDSRQQVQAECRADASAVVIRGPDDRLVFVEVESDQQAATLADEPSDRAKEAEGRPRAEVADRRAGK